MVAWGGLPGGPNPPLNSGWLYEPASGTWTPTSTAPQVPSGRSGHVAVWTGTEMIVWGGASGSTYLSDGGRYCPLQCPTWFRDVDGDGHGTAGVSVVSCVQPGGYVAAGDDCNDADPDFFARPDEIVLLLFAADKITLSWDPGVVTLYDALRGSLAEFPVGSGPSETCLAPMTGTASLQDTQVPLAGQGFWYLVRGRHACLGPYGYRSGPVAEDTSAACP